MVVLEVHNAPSYPLATDQLSPECIFSPVCILPTFSPNLRLHTCHQRWTLFAVCSVLCASWQHFLPTLGFALFCEMSPLICSWYCAHNPNVQGISSLAVCSLQVTVCIVQCAVSNVQCAFSSAQNAVSTLNQQTASCPYSVIVVFYSDATNHRSSMISIIITIIVILWS